MKDKKIIAVGAGRYHSAVCTEHEVFTFGRNLGQLGTYMYGVIIVRHHQSKIPANASLMAPIHVLTLKKPSLWYPFTRLLNKWYLHCVQNR